MVKWEAEMAWVTLPDLGQRALNAINAINYEASELEVASSTAEFHDMMGPSSKSWTLCVAAAAASMPPCVNYIDDIGSHVELFVIIWRVRCEVPG